MSDDKVKLARFSETVPAREHNTDNEELPPLPGCIWSPGPSLTVKRTFSPVCHGCLWAVALANDERQGETSHLLINEVDTRIWPGHATEIRAWHALRVRSDEEQRTVALVSAFAGSFAKGQPVPSATNMLEQRSPLPRTPNNVDSATRSENSSVQSAAADVDLVPTTPVLKPSRDVRLRATK
ncbi:hypothetical protein BST61_g3435 [Cercospora zeina]